MFHCVVFTYNAFVKAHFQVPKAVMFHYVVFTYNAGLKARLQVPKTVMFHYVVFPYNAVLKLSPDTRSTTGIYCTYFLIRPTRDAHADLSSST
jgi:hypothetical protein